MSRADGKPQNIPFGGYHYTQIPTEASDLTHVGPGTQMGEYMRRFWQPVCLSEELGDLPKAIRILGEDLVAFRDKSGNIGVLHRHCAHRGASLEYGIIQDHGIRCCYHGWQFDVDGRLLETPCEPAESKLKDSVCQGSYPAFERSGLVFAYMGPPEEKPEFPEYDCFTQPADNELVAFSNIYPCNWLQVFENVMDHMHTAVLHNHMTVEGVDAETSAGVSLEGFGDMPVMHWEPVHDKQAMVFAAGRRISENRVWIRITEMTFPHLTQIGSLMPSAAENRHSTVGMSRWHVPVDDKNTILFGWRHFNDEADPKHQGDKNDCGVDKIDFLDGQTGDRSYEEGQRAPGDWEALVSQGEIAVHDREHPGKSDIGVYLCRKLLRDNMKAVAEGKRVGRVRKENEQGLHIYSQDSVLNIATATDRDDRDLIMELNKKIVAIMREGDELHSKERDAHIRHRLDDLDGGLN